MIVLPAIGLALSLYAFYVHKKMEDFRYKPFCDISKKVSCTRAFRESESALFGLPNAVLGIIAYLLLILGEIYSVHTVGYVLIPIMFIVSLYLLHILIKKKIWCVVCFATHVINVALMLSLVLQIIR